MSKTPINLKPIAGFCVKTTILQPAIYIPASLSPPKGENVLEPSPGPIPIPTGFKIFVNIAWDASVPPPPQGSEQAIQRAMKGEEIDEGNPDGWYIPVLVSEGRQDKDKAGKLSLVFDCIYNKTVKSRTLADLEFKFFIIELALQRIEAQTSLVLSREIGTPNIASKGKLLPRTVLIPSSLTAGSFNHTPVPASPKALIEEVTHTSSDVTRKGILKPAPPALVPPAHMFIKPQESRLVWKWTKENTRLKITISVPSLSRSLIEQATLDIESRRFIVQIPDCPVLDVNLDLSDAEIVATAVSTTSASLHEEITSEPNSTLTLKRQRDLDVDGATSEWHIAKGVLTIRA